ncbi:MAG: hypothetical protein WBB25_10005 [Sulfitobacter sp.]
MTTPLETYYADEKNMAITPSTTAIAVGTDNDFDSSLLIGIQSLATDGTMPLTLSRFLVRTKAGWTKTANTDWLKDRIADVNITRSYVFHTKLIVALTGASLKGGVVDKKMFLKAYSGNKKATYDEVIILLDSGFTTFNAKDGTLER